MNSYTSKLNEYDTQSAISFVKDRFAAELCNALDLSRVSAPLFVKKGSGINDDLNGVERPVDFDVLETGEICEVVHSLAKWKRMALMKYKFPIHTGLYTDMNAIRRDEKCDNVHSIYVDQWDWEKVITSEDRNEEYLKATVRSIYGAIVRTSKAVCEKYPVLDMYIPENISFVTTYQLEEKYPELTPKQREYEAAREFGAVFIMKIGGRLKNGEKHDGRAPDYDDWTLNGDIIVYYPVLDIAFELSSMGIRVDEDTLVSQCHEAGTDDRLKLDFHKSILDKKIPYTIGGGIGQSRLCMFMLGKAHIGEVQASVWDDETYKICEKEGIELF